MPWQRLRDLRARMPNLLTQMLLRASNGVGYTNYPDNVVQAFVKQAADTGVDVFRVFDSLNWVENMRVAMDAVIETGRICEGTICYTGDLLDPARPKYNLAYYTRMAKELEAAGAHVLGVKDMAGVLKAPAARVLFRALKDAVDLPIHFHTHDTSGAAIATITGRRRGRGGLRRCGDGRAFGQYQPAHPWLGGGGHAPHRARHRPGHGRDPRDFGLLGTGARAVWCVRDRATGPLLRGLSA
jgi:hypothetical protein